MELSKQVTSLEISKRLDELGVKKESLFYWNVPMNECRYDNSTDNLRNEYNISAFTVAELGEMLPKKLINEENIKHQRHQLVIEYAYDEETCVDSWSVLYVCVICKGALKRTFAKTEADARGKMLIYLLENKLI